MLSYTNYSRRATLFCNLIIPSTGPATRTVLSGKNLLLVLGATGAHGIAIIDALLAPGPDGCPSPYAVRALTRDPDQERAQELKAKSVELIKGRSFSYHKVNTDGFTVGEVREFYAGMRIFDPAKQRGNYNPDHRVEHLNGKTRVGEWMKAQESDTSDMECGRRRTLHKDAQNCNFFRSRLALPTQRADDTSVFASKGNGHVSMIALSDIGFARCSFGQREEVSGKDLEVASQMVGWDGSDGLVETSKRVTDQKVFFVRQTVDEWINNFTGVDVHVARDVGEGSTTWRQNFSNSVLAPMTTTSINPNGHTLESRMRANNYPSKLDLDMSDASRFKGSSSSPRRPKRLTIALDNLGSI
ncbi:hypothetical protein DFH11DRAFT_1741782 [Phellopilus nigrolimitatus]|nr:hypothetical protein DFH11DRAFT_1741782 [Phellopilus nigrolimitatus]